MKSRFLAGIIAASLALAAAVPVAAADHREHVRFTPSFPDLVNELVVFVNIDRQSYCTDEVVDFEEAILAWIDSDFAGPPPPEPAFPLGFDPIMVQEKETPKGAIVSLAKGSGLVIELWELDNEADRPFVGPCLDTDDRHTRFARGKTRFQGQDNDLFASGTRGNAFGDRGQANVVHNGDGYRYTWRFRVNDRCYTPEDGPPKCLIETAKLQKR